jgi:hypothetical protein
MFTNIILRQYCEYLEKISKLFVMILSAIKLSNQPVIAKNKALFYNRNCHGCDLDASIFALFLRIFILCSQAPTSLAFYGLFSARPPHAWSL